MATKTNTGSDGLKKKTNLSLSAELAPELAGGGEVVLLVLVVVSFALCLLLVLIAAIKNSGVNQDANGGDNNAADQKASDEQRKLIHCVFRGMIKAPSERILGTQVPTKIAASWSLPRNQMPTERAIEMPAAAIISQRARLELSGRLGFEELSLVVIKQLYLTDQNYCNISHVEKQKVASEG